MNTEHCTGMHRAPCTSQFLLICSYMAVVHFDMKPMLPSFKWYISTYQPLSVLLNIHLNCSYVTVSTIAICLSHIGLAWYQRSPPPSPTNICTSYFSFIIKAYVLSMLTNMLKSESCLIHWIVQVSCLRLELFNHKFHPWTCTTAC